MTHPTTVERKRRAARHLASVSARTCGVEAPDPRLAYCVATSPEMLIENLARGWQRSEKTAAVPGTLLQRSATQEDPPAHVVQLNKRRLQREL
jgi:hypothetical protein